MITVTLDLPPKLSQAVKTQDPLTGQLIHRAFTQAVHKVVPCGGGAAAGARGFHRRGGAGAGGPPQGAAPLAAGVRAGAGQRLPRQRRGALEPGPHRRAGTQDRPAGAGDQTINRSLKYARFSILTHVGSRTYGFIFMTKREISASC